MADTWFERGTTFESQETAVKALRAWVEETDEDTVGEASFGETAWIFFSSPHGQVRINADARRDAVERMLRAEEGGAAWQVVENRDGTINKVVFDLDKATQQGWYAYLVEPLPAPELL